MTTLEALYETLSQSPDDWQTRSILADWFEESGQQACADSVRWMVAQRKRPYRSPSGAYHWFNARRVTMANDPESNLPETVYKLLHGSEGLQRVFRDYASLREAEEDFYAAWALALEGGWDRDA
jgi:uncharacterized protein (TIGR02996 family)